MCWLGITSVYCTDADQTTAEILVFFVIFTVGGRGGGGGGGGGATDNRQT